MKHSIHLIIALLCSYTLSAQDYSLEYPAGKVWISGVDNVKIVGVEGSKVSVSGPRQEEDGDSRAKGLKMINSLGLDDNTGFGVSVKEEDGVLKVYQIGSLCGDDKVTIRVPKDLAIYVDHSTHDGEMVHIENISGEIEGAVNYNDVYLENVTGPMAVKSVYGDIVVEFDELAQEGAISLYSVYGLIDASLPTNAKADVSIRTPYGAVYSNMDIDVDTQSGQSSKNIKGTINGGGVDVSLKASYDNVYLRTK